MQKDQTDEVLPATLLSSCNQVSFFYSIRLYLNNVPQHLTTTSKTFTHLLKVWYFSKIKDQKYWFACILPYLLQRCCWHEDEIPSSSFVAIALWHMVNFKDLDNNAFNFLLLSTNSLSYILVLKKSNVRGITYILHELEQNILYL